MKVKVDFAFFSAYLEGGTDDKDDTHASGLSERDLGLLGDGGASRDAEGGADSDADQRDADGDATDSLDVSQLKDAVADVLTGANGAPVASQSHIRVIKMAQHLDSRRVLLSDPSTFGAGRPNQNTSRIQHKEV